MDTMGVIESIVNEGGIAYCEGLSLGANPYKDARYQARDAWRSGWHNARGAQAVVARREVDDGHKAT